MNVSSVDFTSPDHLNLDNNQYTFRLEFLDYIPVVSIASGAARIAFGLLQTLAAPIQATVSLVDFCLQPSQSLSIDDTTCWGLRGRANLIRGSMAMPPIVGNITVYLFDHSSLAKGWEFRVARSLAWVI